LPVLLISPLITLLKYLVRKYTGPVFRSKLEKKYNGEALNLKVYKSTRNFFKIFYYSFITFLGFYVLSDTEFHSFMMFGKGNFMYLKSDWPYNKVPNLYKMYYMIGMSYHLEDTVSHFFHPIQNDFFEMLLHHYITIMLVMGSHMISTWNFGIIVMIQMDI